MKYTLANLIQNLKHIQQDLPIILTQSENPTIFQHKYQSKIYLEIESTAEVKVKTVGELCYLAQQFARTRLPDEKDFLRKSVHVQRVENERPVDFIIGGLELVGDYVYLVLDEAKLIDES